VLYVAEKMAILRMNRFKRGKRFNELTVTNLLLKVTTKRTLSIHALAKAWIKEVTRWSHEQRKRVHA